MRARSRGRVHRASRALVLALVLALALFATLASARETSGRDDSVATAAVSSPADDAPLVSAFVRARKMLISLAIAIGLRARPALRGKVLSWLAVGVVCVWYLVRRMLTATRQAFTPEHVLAERAAFAREVLSFRRRNPSARSDGTDAARLRDAQEKLHATLAARRRIDGYATELRKLESMFAEGDFHEDMIVDSGNRELDVKDAYERALVASGTSAVKAKAELTKRAAWHKEHELRVAMRSWEGVSASQRKAMYENYQGGWYTANTPLGVPVYVERLGLLNADKLLASGNNLYEHRLRMQGYLMKTLLPEMAKRSGTIARDKIVHIIDMQGAGLWLMSKRNTALFKQLQEIDVNFPEFLYRTYLVNVPYGARAVWAAFSGMIPQRVRAKVRVMGAMSGNNLAKIATIMGGLDNVPDFLGGKCKRRLDECPPWCLPHMNDAKFVSWERNAVDVNEAPATPPRTPMSSFSERFSRSRSEKRSGGSRVESNGTSIKNLSFGTEKSYDSPNAAVLMSSRTI